MILSSDKKFIFIHIPKTGGNSIRQTLIQKQKVPLHIFGWYNGIRQEPNSPNLTEKQKREVKALLPFCKNKEYNQHITLAKLRKLMQRDGFNFDEYFKFAFVRNPWDRVCSVWNYNLSVFKKEGLTDIYVFNKKQHEKVTKTLTTCDFSFKKFVEKYTEYSWQNCQLHWLRNWKKDTVLADYVGRYETLQKDYDIISEKIGLPLFELFKINVNTNKKQHYTEFYDDYTRGLVAKNCKEDIEYFNYKFGE